MYRNWRFFRSNIELFEMVLAKADQHIFEAYLSLVDQNSARSLGTKLVDEYRKTIECLKMISGHHTLLEDNTVLKRSIAVRNPYVDPLNLLQIDFLRRLRSQPEAADSQIKDGFQICTKGIAAGMRNSG